MAAWVEVLEVDCFGSDWFYVKLCVDDVWIAVCQSGRFTRFAISSHTVDSENFSCIESCKLL